jgi:predicted nucleotidyltransferase
MSRTAARAATLLREREAADRAAREGRARDLLERTRKVVLSAVLPGQRVWLIGSLAWGGFGERSDVDLVVSPSDSRGLERLERAVAEATGASVDLLLLDDLPQSFRTRVERDGLRIA